MSARARVYLRRRASHFSPRVYAVPISLRVSPTLALRLDTLCLPPRRRRHLQHHVSLAAPREGAVLSRRRVRDF